MNSKGTTRLAGAALALALTVSFSLAATFTVSKDGRGAYTSVQAAVNAAAADGNAVGDVVKILDQATYSEQVDIEAAASGLTLTSSNPLSLSKPTIRYQDKTNVHPATCAEAKDTNTINFDRNGALRIMRAHNVIVDGIKIDGGGAYAYGYDGIWKGDQDCQHPLQAGNAALVLWVAGTVIIRNCDITNAYAGIKVHDRNEGGIFANANPADLDTFNVVPLSGFGKTGNHVFEYNRIHDNSWGMFFESVWDLGSVIRYNLFYENHHEDNAFASEVKGITSDGQHQPGGALWFKDHWLSPLAVYNNTFWHNFLIFCGHWRPGGQHLIFNNIYAEPNTYWGSDANFQNPWHKMDAEFGYRMKNCVYASQSQAPTTHYVAIMNDFQLQQTGGPIPEGTLITTPFPAEANVRWLETTFLSTDPTDADFLTPDWDDTLVDRYIVDQGWAESGVRDADGTVADLGAIPKGGIPQDMATITPLAPVSISGTKAIVNFSLDVEEGTFTSPQIKYIRFIKGMPLQEQSAFGNNFEEITASMIYEVPVTGQSVSTGGNSLSLTIPALAAGDLYAMFEIVIEGTGSEGKTVASTVGFIPYRKLDYTFDVKVLDLSGTEIDTVTAGQEVILSIEALDKSGSRFEQKIGEVEVNLASAADLLDATGNPFALPGGVEGIEKEKCVFIKVPSGDGLEYVQVSGIWRSTSDPGNVIPFYGTSDGIRIKPGPPAKVVFQDPPSNDLVSAPTVIDPGINFNGSVQVYDQYDNKVDQAVQVQLSSSDDTKGDIVGDKVITTDVAGLGTFLVAVTNGAKDDVFTLTARITGDKTDQADMKVGEPRDQLWIFYSDAGAYEADAELRGEVGERLKVTIWASADGENVLTSRTNDITLNALTSGLKFYASQSAADEESDFSLEDGAVEVWVTSLASVANGRIEVVVGDGDNTLVTGPFSNRGNIYFTFVPTTVDSAFYYADNGTGAVDRAEVYYKKELPAMPDSVILYWPTKTTGEMKVFKSGDAAMSLAADSKHLTITLGTPFAAGITGGSGRGTSYDRPHPDVAAEASDFAIADRVGPLLSEAKLVERFEDGNDTFTVVFSEKVQVEKITGVAFTLIKAGSGKELSLTVVGIAGNVSGQTTVSFATNDLGFESPAAGDSLKILSTGPVVDAYGNHAHAQNTPVEITVVRRPIPVSDAWYFDTDADGMVDRVIVNFAKPVRDLSQLTCTFTWLDDSATSIVASDRFSYTGTDSSIVAIDIAGISGIALTDRTGGDMQATVRFVEFGDDIVADVGDSAAPVIVSARYAPGEILESGDGAPDTLAVVFSENMASISSDQPFVMFSVQEGTEYYVVVDNADISGATGTFLVDTVVGVALPANNDSIWIDATAGVADAGGNEQDNEANKRALLNVKAAPYKVVVTVGPNPFVPGETRIPSELIGSLDGVRITHGVVAEIDLQSKVQAAVTLSAKAQIYDAVGNRVADCSGEDDAGDHVQLVRNQQTGSLYLLWEGSNEIGRIVGPGTYVALITTEDSSGRTERLRARIGVTR
ncbi:MAG: hypothetical protein GF418_05015 [Chitinivibrionales bacterium]|nr:hypothetical protein [Chitinivibrionales bacterium]MBD3394970.1 hypothetical protein [Chitinivibrionales bacterium]